MCRVADATSRGLSPIALLGFVASQALEFPHRPSNDCAVNMVSDGIKCRRIESTVVLEPSFVTATRDVRAFMQTGLARPRSTIARSSRRASLRAICTTIWRSSRSQRRTDPSQAQRQRRPRAGNRDRRCRLSDSECLPRRRVRHRNVRLQWSRFEPSQRCARTRSADHTGESGDRSSTPAPAPPSR